jgi:hypothetical protein
MENCKGKIKFYEDQVDVIFPDNYDKFNQLLGEILGLSDDFMQNIRLSYRDEDNDKIEIKVEDDYKLFINEIKKKKDTMELLVEVKEESNILIKQCSSSILNYVSKNSSLNINNASEDIKEKHKSLDLSDEINPNNIPNENEKKREENNAENKNENNIILNNPNNENQDNQKAYKVILDNNINQNQNLNNINNINNNIQNNNNINNINNIKNDVNNNIINPHQQKIQNQQQQNVVPQKNDLQRNNAYLYILSFPFTCVICRRGPIYRAIYYCKECKIIICPQCELREGPSHLHPLWKAQNSIQFDALNTAGISTMDKFMSDVGSSIEGAYKSVIGFFGVNQNQNHQNQNQNQNQNRNNNPIRGPQWVSLVQLARTSYDLRALTDQQIEQALIKTKGNIDEAVILLTSQ